MLSFLSLLGYPANGSGPGTPEYGPAAPAGTAFDALFAAATGLSAPPSSDSIPNQGGGMELPALSPERQAPADGIAEGIAGETIEGVGEKIAEGGDTIAEGADKIVEGADTIAEHVDEAVEGVDGILEETAEAVAAQSLTSPATTGAALPGTVAREDAERHAYAAGSPAFAPTRPGSETGNPRYGIPQQPMTEAGRPAQPESRAGTAAVERVAMESPPQNRAAGQIPAPAAADAAARATPGTSRTVDSQPPVELRAPAAPRLPAATSAAVQAQEASVAGAEAGRQMAATGQEPVIGRQPASAGLQALSPGDVMRQPEQGTSAASEALPRRAELTPRGPLDGNVLTSGGQHRAAGNAAPPALQGAAAGNPATFAASLQSDAARAARGSGSDDATSPGRNSARAGNDIPVAGAQSGLLPEAARVRQAAQVMRQWSARSATTETPIGEASGAARHSAAAVPTAAAVTQPAASPLAGEASPVSLTDSQAAAEQLVQRVLQGQARHLSSLRLQLSPAELGQLQVHLQRQGDRMNISFTASQPGARDLIEAYLPQLRALLQEAGVQLADVEVRHEAPARDAGRGSAHAGAHQQDGQDGGKAQHGDSGEPGPTPRTAAQPGSADDLLTRPDGPTQLRPGGIDAFA